MSAHACTTEKLKDYHAFPQQIKLFAIQNSPTPMNWDSKYQGYIDLARRKIQVSYTQEMVQHRLVALGLMLSLGQCPRDNTQPYSSCTIITYILHTARGLSCNSQDYSYKWNFSQVQGVKSHWIIYDHLILTAVFHLEKWFELERDHAFMHCLSRICKRKICFHNAVR